MQTCLKTPNEDPFGNKTPLFVWIIFRKAKDSRLKAFQIMVLHYSVNRVLVPQCIWSLLESIWIWQEIFVKEQQHTLYRLPLGQMAADYNFCVHFQSQVVALTNFQRNSSMEVQSLNTYREVFYAFLLKVIDKSQHSLS